MADCELMVPDAADPAPAPAPAAVTHAMPMVKVPHVSDGIVMPSQDSLQPVRKKLVADLCKIIEQQSKEIASLRDSALSGKGAPLTPPPAAAPPMAAVAAEDNAHAKEDDPPLAQSEIANAHERDDDDSSSETLSTEDELPGPDRPTNDRKRPTPGLDVLTAAASNMANTKLSTTEIKERANGKGNERQEQEQTTQRRCCSCGTTTTPKWRCGMTLCNACGLRCIKRQATSRNLAALRQQESDAQIISRQPGGAIPTKRISEASSEAASMSRPFAVKAGAISQHVVPAQVSLSSAITNLPQSAGIVQARAVSTGRIPQMAAQQLNHFSAPQMANGMNQAMCGSGMRQSMFNNMAQPSMSIFNALGQPVAPGFLCAPIGMSVCHAGIGQPQMFPSGMAQQPLFSAGLAQPLFAAASHKLPACGFNSYTPAYAQCL
uniref:GATA-type domain-containing protein n=1 Tax=Calcidiscus leptoporus TaxID=127549 RepID=A0A7S0NRT5_9EUKA|eukprot:CAMPEP_0119374100 /NCGR_PEP_ID=MMETSP1334-20130426/28997_1 /TAXON_ID=127549 /ORGANISM="Calcidiscus leptoporus, Strain RCC1130" /LENGTH=433 /DNA_ID=CAMNT_0007392065 /DNA_START=48 /DNA_END=1349 /DNA_ORIENTATION=-